MNDLLSSDVLRQLYDEARISELLTPEQFDQGMMELRLGALKLAAEVLDAACAGFPFTSRFGKSIALLTSSVFTTVSATS